MNKRAILYSTGCPKCKILKMKLDTAQIPYTENYNIDEMQMLGMTEAPALMVNGELLGFGDACRWAAKYVSEHTPAG